jgi:hypothetical protein
MGIQRKNDQADEHLTLAELCKRLNADHDHAFNSGKIFDFCSNLGEYQWLYRGKREVLVPFHFGPEAAPGPQHKPLSNTVDAKSLRWEKHQLCIVDGELLRGESNVMARRRLYVDETSWQIVFGEAYDNAGTLISWYMLGRAPAPDAEIYGKWYAT